MATRPVLIRNSSSRGVIAELHPLSHTLAVIDLLDSLLGGGHEDFHHFLKLSMTTFLGAGHLPNHKLHLCWNCS
jgi:hypothetical protein